MSEAIYALSATSRHTMGKGASRRLRREADQVPAIIYGGEKDASPITLEHRHIQKALSFESFYSHILTVTVDGVEEKVVLKDLQRHPYKKQILHVDFLRVDANSAITMQVPVHFLNEDVCAGVKAGGVISHTLADVEVKCLPQNLPEFLEVDMANVEIGQIIHLSDLALPKGVELPELALGDDHDHPVASVQAPKASKEDAADDAEASEGEGA